MRNGKLQRHWKHSARLDVIKPRLSTITPKHCSPHSAFCVQVREKDLKTRTMLSVGIKITGFIGIADVNNFSIPTCGNPGRLCSLSSVIESFAALSPALLNRPITASWWLTSDLHLPCGRWVCKSAKVHMPVSCNLLSPSLCLNY